MTMYRVDDAGKAELLSREEENARAKAYRRCHPVMRTVVAEGDCAAYIGRLRWSKDNDGDEDESPLPYWVNYEIVQRVGRGEPDMYSGEMHPVEDIDEAEVCVDGFIKWDGCMQWRADAHTDDADDLELLFDCIRKTREAAIEAMGTRWHARPEWR